MLYLQLWVPLERLQSITSTVSETPRPKDSLTYTGSWSGRRGGCGGTPKCFSSLFEDGPLSSLYSRLQDRQPR